MQPNNKPTTGQHEWTLDDPIIKSHLEMLAALKLIKSLSLAVKLNPKALEQIETAIVNAEAFRIFLR